MAVLINPPKSFETTGEKRVAKCLKTKLHNDCLFWYNIPIGKKRLYPDFVVLIPDHGLLALEVKDWKVDTFKKINKETATIQTKTGTKQVTHPIKQARNSIFPIIDMLEADPILLQQINIKYHGKLCFPYSYAVVFTNITRKQFHKAIPAQLRPELLPDNHLICKNDITTSTNTEDFHELLRSMFDYQYGKPLTNEQINRIRWHLFPEIRIQADMFDITDESDNGQVSSNDEPLRNIVKETPQDYIPTTIPIPNIIKIMDIQQEQLARSMGDGHRVIHGVAGSGKTIILLHRCLYLAKISKKPILVLCYNITLAQKLSASIEQRGIKNVEVNNFNAWCASQLGKHKIQIIKGAENIWERQIKSMIQAVDKGKIPKGQYNAILIDEGHDFEPEWLKLVVQMIDPITNSLLLLYDDAQSIYKKKSSLNFTLASVGIQAQGRTTILKINYRNTQEILQFAYQFAKNHFPQPKNSDIPIIAPEAAGGSGNKPIVTKFKYPQQEIKSALETLEKLNKEGKEWGEIAIIAPIIANLKEIAEAMDKENIPYQLLVSRKGKRNYQPNINKITLITTTSSKGLEFDTAIILNASFVYGSNDEETEEETDINLLNSIRRLYVAMTRAQNLLFISYWKDNEVSELLKATNKTIN